MFAIRSPLTVFRRIRRCELAIADIEERQIKEAKRRAAAKRWEAEELVPVDPIPVDQAIPKASGSFLAPAEFAARKWKERFGGSKPRQSA